MTGYIHTINHVIKPLVTKIAFSECWQIRQICHHFSSAPVAIHNLWWACGVRWVCDGVCIGGSAGGGGGHVFTEIVLQHEFPEFTLQVRCHLLCAECHYSVCGPEPHDEMQEMRGHLKRKPTTKCITLLNKSFRKKKAQAPTMQRLLLPCPCYLSSISIILFWR